MIAVRKYTVLLVLILALTVFINGYTVAYAAGYGIPGADANVPGVPFNTSGLFDCVSYSEYSLIPANCVEGYIKNVTPQTVEIEDYNGYIWIMYITPKSILEIDQRTAQIQDFKVGMEVYAEKRGNNIIKMEGYSTENLGYIVPGSKVKTGTVTKIDRNQLTMRTATGKEENYFISPVTLVFKESRNVPASTLYVGDNVKLYFDNIYTNTISRISVQGSYAKIKGIYKGVVDIVDNSENAIVLKDVSSFSNGEFIHYDNVVKIKHSADTPFYIESQSIPLQNLKFYKGKTAYVVVKDFFGKDKTDKVVIKNNYETTYNDKITSVNWYSETLELKNKKNIAFNDGTIFIKNGRLVDKFAINSDQDAFIVADSKGTKANADLIYIYNEDINNSNIGQYYLYAGKFDKIVQNEFTIKEFFLLDKNQWESFKEEKTLYYDNDTYIFDAEEGKRISVEEFYTKDYAVDEKSDYALDKDLTNWSFYAFTDGDRSVALLLQKDMDSLLRQRVTAGIVEKIEEDPHMGTVIYLRDARDFSRHNSKWMSRALPVKIKTSNSLIVKNDLGVNWDEIKPGDSIFCVRDDINAKFILIK